MPPLLLFVGTLVVASCFLVPAQGHEEAGRQQTRGHECVHDQIRRQPGYGPTAKVIPNVRYPIENLRSNTSFHAFHRSLSEAHRLATLTKDVKHRHFKKQQSTYSAMRFSINFDQGDCPGGSSTCGHCTAVGDTVTTFSGSTTTCREEDVLTASKKAYVMNTLMPKAAEYLGTALQVVPVTGNLVLSGISTCGGNPGTPVASAHTTTGAENADMIVYVTAAPLADSTSATVAWASACAEDDNGRPIGAHVNWIPSKLTNADALNPVAQENDVATAIHEIAHALGFAAPFFGSKGYLNTDGSYATSGGTLETTSSTLGKSVSYIASPKVKAEVQSFFSCSTANGAEIEDQGGSGTAGSHFEKRVHYTDLMSGISSSVLSFPSRVWLAFFEDTGHYQVDYNQADSRQTWGKGKGCDFLNAKCNNDPTPKTSGEFCFDTDSNNMYCTADYLARGYCDATSGYTSALPSYFQYFSDSSTTGSAVQHGDYCPVVAPYGNLICVDSTLSDSQDIYASAYKSNSRCFISDLISDSYAVATSNKARCFEASCASGAITLTIKGNTFACPSDGSAGAADLTGLSNYHGSVTCPLASDFCQHAPSGASSTPATAVPNTPSPPAPPGVPPATPVPRTASPGAASYNGVTEGVYDYPAQAGLPASCSARASCMDPYFYRLQECRFYARKVVDCFGSDCNSEMETFLEGLGVAKNCTDRTKYATHCMEGVAGVTDLCPLAGASPLGVAVAVVLVAVAAFVW